MTFNEWTDAINHLATTAAILIGGGWALFRYGRNREDEIQGVLDHAGHEALRLADGRTYVRIAVRFHNTGEVPIYPWWTRGIVCKMLPYQELPQIVDGDCDWPAIEHTCYLHAGEDFIVEPGETTTWWLGHVIAADCDVVAFQTYVYCAAKTFEDPEQYGFPKPPATLDLAAADTIQDDPKWVNSTYNWHTSSVVDLREAGKAQDVRGPVLHVPPAAA